MLPKYRYRTKPYDHQQEALEKSWNQEDYALFMEMGTGKSKVLIDNIAILYDIGRINKALIIAPKGVYQNWERNEIPKHLPDHILHRVALWNSSPNKKEQKKLEKVFETTDDLCIFLMNIEALSTKKGVAIADKFLIISNSLMAIDESTTIKSPSARRTKACLKLRILAKYRRILTGQPITKSPLDIYTQCSFLDPALLGYSSYYSFRNRYAVMVKRSIGTHSFSKIVGYQNLDELQKELVRFSYRKLKEECLDLPDKVYTIRYVTLTDEQKRMYEQLKRYAVTELEGKTVTAQAVITQILRLHQVVCGFIRTDDSKLREVSSNRIKELLALCEEIDGKAIIWANYRYDIEKITKELNAIYGYGSAAHYYGGTANEERQNIVDRFQDKNSMLRFFVGQPRTGGFGLTLTAANTVIYYSNNYDLEIRIQSEDRAHRIGQHSKVTYIDLMAENTVDSKIVNSLRRKINIASQVMGEGWKDWLI
jgi:SNF2 family DNA or RNA helicase